MMQPLLKAKAAFALAILFLVACSRNPEKEQAAFLSSAQKLVQAGKFQEAVIQFRSAIELAPRSPDPHYQLARIYLKLKALNPAYQEFLSTVQLDPNNIDAQLQLAALMIAGRKYDDARKTAETILAADPRNARAHNILGQRHAALEAWPQAIREFQTALSLDPKDVESYAGLAAAYASTSRVAEAEATLRKATEVQPRSVDAIQNLGQFYLSVQRPVEAEAALRQASRVDPQATLPRRLLVKMYLESGKPAEAEQLCRELKNIAPDDPDGFGALASFYEATSQKEKLAAELQALVAAKPHHLAIKTRLTDALIDLHRLDEANRLNVEALGVNPADPRALTSKARLLIGQEKYEEAKPLLAQALQSDAQSAPAHYLLGVAESSLGHFQSARTSLARAHQLAPGLTDATLALADVESRAGQYNDDALLLAQQVLQSNPDSVLAHVVVARVAIAKGNPAQADAHLRTALDRDPASLPALGAWVDLQASQGKPQEAVQRISTILSQHPNNARLHLLLGVGYFKHNELDRAEASTRRALSIDPKTPDAYGLLAEISRARGSFGQAVAHYKDAVEKNPNKIENYMALADIYQRQGNWEDAKRAAEHAHSLDPASPYIANNLAYLYLEHGGDVNLALSLAQQAKQKLPGSPIISDTIGWAYYKLGSASAAVEQLTESVERAPTNPMYQYHLGMAYIAAGNPGKAVRSLQVALSAGPDFPYAESARTALHKISRNTP